ncbi:MAG: hypothetical protein ACI4A8_09740 [Muribaculaceae bacterium]
MEIVVLNGTDNRLYQLVAPLTMNVDAIKYNNGYPFKTDDTYVWHLAIGDDGKVSAFMPVRYYGHSMYIDNYFISGDSDELLQQLLESVLSMHEKWNVCFMAHNRHAKTVEAKGFVAIKHFVKYVKMEYCA